MSCVSAAFVTVSQAGIVGLLSLQWTSFSKNIVLPCLAPATPLQKYLLSAYSLPVLLGLAWCVCYGVAYTRAYSRHMDLDTTQFHHALWQIILLCYTSVNAGGLGLVYCMSVGSARLLVADESVECSGSGYTMATIVGMMVSGIVSIVLPCFIVWCHASRKLVYWHLGTVVPVSGPGGSDCDMTKVAPDANVQSAKTISSEVPVFESRRLRSSVISEESESKSDSESETVQPSTESIRECTLPASEPEHARGGGQRDAATVGHRASITRVVPLASVAQAQAKVRRHSHSSGRRDGASAVPVGTAGVVEFDIAQDEYGEPTYVGDVRPVRGGPRQMRVVSSFRVRPSAAGEAKPIATQIQRMPLHKWVSNASQSKGLSEAQRPLQLPAPGKRRLSVAAADDCRRVSVSADTTAEVMYVDGVPVIGLPIRPQSPIHGTFQVDDALAVMLPCSVCVHVSDVFVLWCCRRFETARIAGQAVRSVGPPQPQS